MDLLTIAAVLGLWFVGLGVLGWALRRQMRRATSRRRLSESGHRDEQALPSKTTGVRRWLHRAGYRGRRAPALFAAAQLAALVLAGLVVAALLAAGGGSPIEDILRAIPGGVGEVFLPLVWFGPWLAGLVVASLPVLVVRSARRRRVASVEQDLPAFLDLLSTLAEAGLSFDAAVSRILDSQRGDRPLASDLRLFQLDIVGGRSRLDALTRLRDRVDVPWFGVFVSALIHAEQIGAGLARTLKLQAEDLRMRRRERALERAMQIPVKLVFPLVVCFLPGIFVATLGPIALQLFRSADGLLQGAGVR